MYFIGIVPPEDYLERIQLFQSRWINFSGVEPHITLKAQGGLTRDQKWLDPIKEACKGIQPFQITLGGPDYFGGTILYLSVESEQLFHVHRKIVEAVDPSEADINHYFELDAYVPHLTLGKETYGGNISTGLTKEQLHEMERDAEEELSPFPSFEASFLRIYQLNGKRYEPIMDIPFGN